MCKVKMIIFDNGTQTPYYFDSDNPPQWVQRAGICAIIPERRVMEKSRTSKPLKALTETIRVNGLILQKKDRKSVV